jgi:hypothetical protein
MTEADRQYGFATREYQRQRCDHVYVPLDPQMKHFPRGEFVERCVKCGKERKVETV